MTVTVVDIRVKRLFVKTQVYKKIFRVVNWPRHDDKFCTFLNSSWFLLPSFMCVRTITFQIHTRASPSIFIDVFQIRKFDKIQIALFHFARNRSERRKKGKRGEKHGSFGECAVYVIVEHRWPTLFSFVFTRWSFPTAGMK